MCRAEFFAVFGHSPISPYTFVAMTVFCRRCSPFANHRPMICSVTPSHLPRPYTSAVSKKLIPISCAWSISACASFSGVNGPKFIVPRHSRDTFKPVRPREVYCMGRILRGRGGGGNRDSRAECDAPVVGHRRARPHRGSRRFSRAKRCGGALGV